MAFATASNILSQAVSFSTDSGYLGVALETLWEYFLRAIFQGHPKSTHQLIFDLYLYIQLNHL
jgi:hypothetical protein